MSQCGIPTLFYGLLVEHLRTFDAYAGPTETEAILPDLRGLFLRGLNQGRSDGLGNPEPGDDNIGRYQAASSQLPANPFRTNVAGSHAHDSVRLVTGTMATPTPGVPIPIVGPGPTSTAGDHDHEVVSGGDVETRPRSASVLFIIAYG